MDLRTRGIRQTGLEVDTSVRPEHRSTFQNDRALLAPSPPPVVAQPLAQAILTTFQPRNASVMASHANAFLVDGGIDQSPGTQGGRVRLLAYYTPAYTSSYTPAYTSTYTSAYTPAVCEDMKPRGLVILLHGWEGCSHSIFNLVLGSRLVEAGYDVVRLNLRDHGPVTRIDPIYLNEGLFLGTLLEEVAAAVSNLRSLRRHGPIALVGASLGGNYALRLASFTLNANDERQDVGLATGTPLVDRAIAVSPVVNPARSVDLIDGNRPFRSYFRARWLASLQRKQMAFPHRYDFRGVERLTRIRPMTEWLVRRYSDFPSADAYLNGYAFLGEEGSTLRTPTALIAAKDDPVIPVEDVMALADSPYLQRQILDWGGHAGLISWPPLRHHMPELILQILSDAS